MIKKGSKTKVPIQFVFVYGVSLNSTLLIYFIPFDVYVFIYILDADGT